MFFSLFLSVFSGPTAWISLKVDQPSHECVRIGLLYLDHSSNPILDVLMIIHVVAHYHRTQFQYL